MYVVYILKSKLNSRYYIGHTGNLNNRLEQHNKGDVRWTSRFIPWEVIYTEEYSEKSEAYKREMQIKRYKGGRAFKKLIGN